PIRRRIGTDPDEARRVAAETNARLESGRPTTAAFRPVAVTELVRDWLDFHESVRRSSLATIRRYRAATQHLVDFASGPDGFRSAHELDTQRFAHHLRTVPVSSNGHANTPKRLLRDKGVQFILGACRSLYSFAARRRVLPPYFENPFSELGIERLQVEDAKSIHVFSSVEAAAFLEACDDWQFPIFFALCQTGLRPGELVHVLIDDADLERRVLHIRCRPTLGWQTKTRNERIIPILPVTAEVLRRVIGTRSAGVLFRRRRFTDGERPPLGDRDARALEQALRERTVRFRKGHHREPSRLERSDLARRLWSDAGMIRPSRLRLAFMQVTGRIGLGHVTAPKTWRHTFATTLQDANVDPLIRQQVMGHSPGTGHRSSGGLGMTSIYTHTRPETYRRQICRALSLNTKVLEITRTRLACGDRAALPAMNKGGI
ncbi:MAG: tyrosine-type recombinase/integrase, partial [Phycisphaerae bacterium]